MASASVAPPPAGVSGRGSGPPRASLPSSAAREVVAGKVDLCRVALNPGIGSGRAGSVPTRTARVAEMADAWLPVLIGLGQPAAIIGALLLQDCFLEPRGRERVRPCAVRAERRSGLAGEAEQV